MKSLLSIAMLISIVVMAGCSSGIKVSQKPNPTDKIAIVSFKDCTDGVDCAGSGKKVTKAYSESLGAPVFSTLAEAKGYDILLGGLIKLYEDNSNNSKVTVIALMTKVEGNKHLITQFSTKNSTGLLKRSPEELAKELAEDMKNAMK